MAKIMFNFYFDEYYNKGFFLIMALLATVAICGFGAAKYLFNKIEADARSRDLYNGPEVASGPELAERIKGLIRRLIELLKKLIKTSGGSEATARGKGVVLLAARANGFFGNDEEEYVDIMNEIREIEREINLIENILVGVNSFVFNWFAWDYYYLLQDLRKLADFLDIADVALVGTVILGTLILISGSTYLAKLEPDGKKLVALKKRAEELNEILKIIKDSKSRGGTYVSFKNYKTGAGKAQVLTLEMISLILEELWAKKLTKKKWTLI